MMRPMGDEPKTALVALRDRREAVIQVLTDSFANDLLDVDAFDERLARAHLADTVAALEALVADLAPLPDGAAHTALAPLDDARPAPVARAPRGRVTAVFSSIERRGRWVVPPATRAVSVFGSAELDFREASFAEGVTELHVRAVFGNIEIIVPPQLAVECEGAALFGSFEQGASAVADPGRPLLRIRGSAIFGNVEVSTRLPGENERDARRRERKALPPGK